MARSTTLFIGKMSHVQLQRFQKYFGCCSDANTEFDPEKKSLDARHLLSHALRFPANERSNFH